MIMTTLLVIIGGGYPIFGSMTSPTPSSMSISSPQSRSDSSKLLQFQDFLYLTTDHPIFPSRVGVLSGEEIQDSSSSSSSSTEADDDDDNSGGYIMNDDPSVSRDSPNHNGNSNDINDPASNSPGGETALLSSNGDVAYDDETLMRSNLSLDLESQYYDNDDPSQSPRPTSQIGNYSNSLLEGFDDKDSKFFSTEGYDGLLGPGNESSTNNKTLEELLAEELLIEYPLRDPLSIAIPMTLIYLVILLSALLGNISTCVVIARTNYMHTATNYYLFSLAMSDLLLLMSGLPQEMYHIWFKYPYIFGEAFCVIRGLSAETSANATVLTITAFTVERFVAIVYPLKSHKLSQLSRVVRMIGIIWLVAFCLALPQAAQFGVTDQMSRHDNSTILIKGAWCTLVREIFPYAFQISICVFFAIPMTIITVLYVLIGLNLRRSRKGPITRNTSQELTVEPRVQNRHSQSHVIRMLVAVVVAFFICWAPFHAQRLMALYGKAKAFEGEPVSKIFMIIYQGVTHVSGILYYISTCINPILYHTMSNKFRQAFRDTISQLCGGPSPRQNNRTYSAISHRSSRKGPFIYSSQRGYRHGHRDSSLLGVGTICPNCREMNSNVHMYQAKVNGRKIPCSCQKSVESPGSMMSSTYSVAEQRNNGHSHNARNNIIERDNKDGRMIPLANLNNISQGPVILSSQPQNSSSNNSSSSSNSCFKKPEQSSTSLKGFLSRKKDCKIPMVKKFSEGSILKSSPNRNRPPSDPNLSSYAMTILDSKGNSKTVPVPVGILHRPRTGSGGNAGNIAGIHKNPCRATSYGSVASTKSNNTISNSSLQDLDESEYTGEELAGYMAELNHNLETVPN